MKIEKITVHEISDSRGEPTIEAVLSAGGGVFSAQIPSGKSRGKSEAAVLSTDSAQNALKEFVAHAVIGKDFENIRALDSKLITLDGTANKSRIGGNLALGISVSFARALAASRGMELWEVLKEEFFPKENASLPFIFSNLINGGAHANNNLDIQEYMIIVDTSASVSTSFKKLKDFFGKLRKALSREKGSAEIPFGDEGGYSLNFSDNFAPIEILQKLIRSEKLDGEFRIGLDAAASSFYKGGAYHFGGQGVSAVELLNVYAGYFSRASSLYSIEDPFAETDHNGFRDLLAKFPDKLIVGDDITVTNQALIAKLTEGKCINGVIIKPNQIGTLTETCEAMRAAKARSVKCIVSHRSGETQDSFIIHIARAGGAYGVKIGAPSKSERLSKFEELLRLYS